MIKYFVNKWGDKFVFCGSLQSLTAPIFLPVEYRWHCDWDTVADVTRDEIAEAAFDSIEAALASLHGVKLEVQYKFIDVSGVDQPILGTLPYAILELHPENGARLWMLACTGPHQFECWNADQFAIDHAIKARVLVRDY
jgi:hypothetical protein